MHKETLVSVRMSLVLVMHVNNISMIHVQEVIISYEIKGRKQNKTLKGAVAIANGDIKMS